MAMALVLAIVAAATLAIGSPAGRLECDGIALDVLANRYPEVERPTSRPTRC